ncbi:hypothetical protein, partial [Bacillus altitudinis]
SFITSYLLINHLNNGEVFNKFEYGLNSINQSNKLIFNEPAEYIDQAELVLDVNDTNLSQRDIVDLIFEAKGIPHSKQQTLRDIVQRLRPESVNRKEIEEVITSNLRFV